MAERLDVVSTFAPAGDQPKAIASLAESSLLVHGTHAAAVDPALARRAHANDLTLLARGRIRQRRYGDARAALAEAASLQPAGARERMLRARLAVPGVRALLGRRGPYPVH